ncbi:MAG: hypothetical protein ACYC0D_08540 [Candidatus Humimicrobiaceae bacterium]
MFSLFFWIIFGLFILIFLIGFFTRISIWLGGAESGIYNKKTIVTSKWIRFFKYVGSFLKRLFSRDFFKILKSFLKKSIIHVDLFKSSKLKSFIHIFMFWGFATFFIVTIVYLIFVAVAPGGFPIYHLSWFFMAILLDIPKMIIIFGVLMAVVRFIILKNKKKSVELKDKSAGIFIAIIVLFGFLYEASFILSNNIPSGRAIFMPAGFVISLIFSYIKINWSIISKIFLYIHMVLLFAFVAYIPYGKYSHMVFGPIVAFINKRPND